MVQFKPKSRKTSQAQAKEYRRFVRHEDEAPPVESSTHYHGRRQGMHSIAPPAVRHQDQGAIVFGAHLSTEDGMRRRAALGLPHPAQAPTLRWPRWPHRKPTSWLADATGDRTLLANDGEIGGAIL